MRSMQRRVTEAQTNANRKDSNMLDAAKTSRIKNSLRGV